MYCKVICTLNHERASSRRKVLISCLIQSRIKNLLCNEIFFFKEVLTPFFLSKKTSQSLAKNPIIDFLTVAQISRFILRCKFCCHIIGSFHIVFGSFSTLFMVSVVPNFRRTGGNFCPLCEALLRLCGTLVQAGVISHVSADFFPIRWLIAVPSFWSKGRACPMLESRTFYAAVEFPTACATAVWSSLFFEISSEWNIAFFTCLSFTQLLRSTALALCWSSHSEMTEDNFRRTIWHHDLLLGKDDCSLSRVNQMKTTGFYVKWISSKN